MELPDTHEQKKFGIVLLVLILLVGGFVAIRVFRERKLARQLTQNQVVSPSQIVSPSPDVPPGVYTILPSQSTIKSGATLALTVQFEAPGKKLDGSDVFLRFDPVFLDVNENLVFGDYFSTYPRVTIDRVKGEVKVTGFRTNQTAPITTATAFFTIAFTGKQAGNTAVSFEFAKGKTNLTTLVEKGTSRNILGKVYPAAIRIE